MKDLNKCEILDVCCGSRMFYFNRKNDDVIFMDNRTLDTKLCDGRTLKIDPDIIGDFKKIPFPDERFKAVIFDPPHLIRGGDSSWIVKKYGKLNRDTWRSDLSNAFNECMRVLKEDGLLIFKWNEDQIKLHEVLKCFKEKPLLGNRTSKNTIWLVFIKHKRKEDI